MKKELLIKKISDQSHIERIVSMHHEIFCETKLFGKLIYFDNNFPNYFSKLFHDENNYVFGVFKDKEILGFLHLKKINNILFLNNIFLDKKIRGNGAGTFILRSVLSESFVKDNGFEYLELDVFESNVIAKKWYDKLGFETCAVSDWYFVENRFRNLNIQHRFKVSNDDNGFKSLFFDSHKVATIIKDSSIIVHDNIALNFDSNLSMLIKQSENINFSQEMNFIKFDTSIRMRGKISNIFIENV